MFDGDYNEAESAASFQQALAAWRTGKSEGGEPAKESTSQPQVLKVETPRTLIFQYYVLILSSDSVVLVTAVEQKQSNL